MKKICLCNAVPRDRVIYFKKLGVKTIEELQQHIDICDTCYGCEDDIEALLNSKDESSDDTIDQTEGKDIDEK